MYPLKCEQARRETQQWVMRRLPTADSIVEIGRKSRSWIKSRSYASVCYLLRNGATCGGEILHADACRLCVRHGSRLMSIGVIVTINFRQKNHISDNAFTLPKVNKIQNVPSAIFLTLCRVPTFLLYNVSIGAGKHSGRVCSLPWGVATRSSQMTLGGLVFVHASWSEAEMSHIENATRSASHVRKDKILGRRKKTP